MIHSSKLSAQLGLFFVLILSLVLFQSCDKDPVEEPGILVKPGVYDISVKVDTMTRWFKTIVPSNYNHANEHPILLAYHGGGLSMGFMLKNRTDLIQRCEDENWILVFPNGANHEDNRGSATWNALHCCNPALKWDVDDIGFTKTIIDTISTELNIDRKRIYAIGGSNGGMLVHRIAAELSDIFAAVAENQGSAGGRQDSLSELTLAQPNGSIPFILIHGMNDVSVKFQGGWSGDLPRYDISFSETVSLWAINNSCNPIPDTTITQGLRGKVWIFDYDGCENNSDVRAIAIENKGHGWPGLEESGFDGTNESIDFLSQYSK